MEDSAKYLIHADITTDGVVERSDVVGAVFGQTEGLLGDEMDLRELQQGSKVGRIDVEITSQRGQSSGELRIATSMDKVETAILAASLETIERVGPCRATVTVSRIEDVRAAKRREVVDRARDLLANGFDDTVLTSHELVRKVRESTRIDDITEYAGYPAGPNVANSDAIILVEGRSDVLALLRYGIKNAVAVEGTNVPEEIAKLTGERTVTAFLDGDRGGELILKELEQVGDVDYVAFAPAGRSVEDLDRHDVLSALRSKVPYERVVGVRSPLAAVRTDGPAGRTVDQAGSVDRPPETLGEQDASSDGHTGGTASGSETAVTDPETAIDHGTATNSETDTATDGSMSETRTATQQDVPSARSGTVSDAGGPDGSNGRPPAVHESDEHTDPTVAQTAETERDGSRTDIDDSETDPSTTETIGGHVDAVIGEGTGTVRLLDGDWTTLSEVPVADAYDAIASVDQAPHAVVLDGRLSQRELDISAQRGIDQIVSREFDEFTKRPTSVRIRTADQLHVSNES